jgi:hypothetical protein
MLRWYATLSGADTQYGFFAPDVGAQYRTSFLLQNERGTTWCDAIENTANPEARLRLVEIVENGFANGAAAVSAARRHRLVASWAASMFTRHPSAVSLVVIVESQDLPTMTAFHAGQRPRWAVVYRAQVQRASAAGQGPRKD